MDLWNRSQCNRLVAIAVSHPSADSWDTSSTLRVWIYHNSSRIEEAIIFIKLLSYLLKHINYYS